MIIDSINLNGECTCGKTHTMITKAVIIENDALNNFEKYMQDYCINGKRACIYDKHTFKATNGKHPKCNQEVLMDQDIYIHANEKATEYLNSVLDNDIEVVIAIGSGTVHDTVRYVANERKIHFVSCPTAASVDGFCSTVSAMTWFGYKKTLPGIAPEIVIADINVIKNAPKELIKAGVGDILAKYTALFDWKVSHILTNEYLCERIYNMMKEAVDKVVESLPGINDNKDDSYFNVTYALILSGLAMQLMGNSRPASGAEHHISHFIEINPNCLEVKFEAYHGEKTGVGVIYASEEYHRLLDNENTIKNSHVYNCIDQTEILKVFGPELHNEINDVNNPCCITKVRVEKLRDKWSEIQKNAKDLPTGTELKNMLLSIGAKTTLNDIGVDEKHKEIIFKYSPLIRNRLTFMRIRQLLV